MRPVVKRLKLVLSLILTLCKLQSINIGKEVITTIIILDSISTDNLIIVAIMQPINKPVHRQHNGKQKDPICGARSGRPLQRGALPNSFFILSIIILTTTKTETSKNHSY